MAKQRKKYHLFIISSVLVIIFICMYLSKRFVWLNLSLVNLYCVFFAFLNLALAFVETENKGKAYSFLASFLISIIGLTLNFRVEFSNVKGWFDYITSLWSLIWICFFVISLLSALIILIRIYRWSQKEWEIAKQLQQERYLNTKKYWVEWANAQRAYNTEKLLKTLEYKRKLQEAEQNNKLQQLMLKLQIKTIELQLKLLYAEEKIKESENALNDKVNASNEGEKRETINRLKKGNKEENPTGYFRKLDEKIAYFKVAFFITVLMVSISLFILVPVFSGWTNAVNNWIDAVKKLIIVLMGDKAQNLSGQQILLYYLLFCIVVAFAILAFGIVVLSIVKNILINVQNRTNESQQLETYVTPIAVLVVSLAILYIFSNGDIEIPNITDGWSILIIVVLFFLIVFTAIEILRIVLEQCIQSKSLLKKIIRLVFVLVLDLLSSILLGVLTSLHIQTIISSLFLAVLPGKEGKLGKYVNKVMEELFCKEVTEIRTDSDKTSSYKEFSRQQIWRRYKK